MAFIDNNSSKAIVFSWFYDDCFKWTKNILLQTIQKNIRRIKQVSMRPYTRINNAIQKVQNNPNKHAVVASIAINLNPVMDLQISLDIFTFRTYFYIMIRKWLPPLLKRSKFVNHLFPNTEKILSIKTALLFNFVKCEEKHLIACCQEIKLHFAHYKMLYC